MKIELITWKDASSDSDGWKAVDDIDDTNPVVKSIGFVVKDTPNNITIAQDICDDGDTHGRGRVPKGMLISRQELVPVGNDCIEWPGRLDSHGYGQVGTRIYGTRLAHRIVFMMAHGKTLTSDQLLCHKCDNRKCINPNHLYIGDHATNAADREATGISTQALATSIAAAKLRARTRCRKGHLYTPENTYLMKDSNARRCRTCNRENQKKSQQRRKQVIHE